MKIKVVLALVACIAVTTAVSRAQNSVPIFSDDFSTSTKFESLNPYVGGFYTPQLPFQKWTGGPDSEVSISSGVLTVNSSSGTRTAGIVLSNTLFSGAGNYVLTFDMKSYTGSTNNTALASVWSGKGFDLAQTANALIVDTSIASLTAQGNAQVAKLAETNFNTVGNGKTLTFAYDGISAVGIFLGVKTTGFPFPSATFDNVTVSKLSAVPEPSASILFGLAAFCSTLVRRRK